MTSSSLKPSTRIVKSRFSSRLASQSAPIGIRVVAIFSPSRKGFECHSVPTLAKLARPAPRVLKHGGDVVQGANHGAYQRKCENCVNCPPGRTLPMFVGV